MMTFFGKLFGKRQPAPSTGRVMTSQAITELVGFTVFAGDAFYAQVDSAWLAKFYADFRKTLFNQGVVKWDGDFDCDDFAAFYVALAKVRYFTTYFNTFMPAQSLAVGEFWYKSANGSHAVVIAATERGLVFIEPQSGAILNLTPEEKASCSLCKF